MHPTTIAVDVAKSVFEVVDSGLPGLLRPALAEAAREIRAIEERIRSIEHQLEAIAEQTPVVGQLRTIPGVTARGEPPGREHRERWVRCTEVRPPLSR